MNKPLAVFLVVAHAAAAASAQEWTRFRGPNGSGVSSTQVPVQWTDKDYDWTVRLPGKGHSSPVLWGERLFITCGEKETGARIVLCLHADTGRELWRRSFPSQTHRTHSLNSFASATPPVDARHVYVCWATPEEYVVLALDHAGKEGWRRDLGPYKTGHGFGVSPIVFEESSSTHGSSPHRESPRSSKSLLIVPNEQEGDSSLIALRTATGKTQWRLARDSRVTYSTPCVFRPRGRPAELIFTNWTYGITGHDARTGKMNWGIKVFGKDHLETAIGSPIVSGELVLGTCGYLGKGNHTVAVRPYHDGRLDAREVYRVERGAPLTTTPLAVHVQNAGELLFLWTDDGIATCVDATNGELHWRKRIGGTFYGSPVCAGRHIYCISADGEVVVLAASKTFEQIARVPLGEPSNSTPAIARGRMYLRTETRLMALGGK